MSEANTSLSAATDSTLKEARTPSIAPKVTSPDRLKKTHLTPLDMHQHHMSWISVSRYQHSNLSFLEQLHTELRDMGAIEIMLGMIQMLFGIPLIFSESYAYPAIIGAPWFTGIWYVISGSVTIRLIYSKKALHRWVVLVMHMFSVVSSAVGCVLFNLSIFVLPTPPFNYFMTSPLIVGAFLMIFSAVELIVALLISYLYVKLLSSEKHNRKPDYRTGTKDRNLRFNTSSDRRSPSNVSASKPGSRGGTI